MEADTRMGRPASVALAGGALVGHGLIGELVFAKAVVDRVGLTVLIILPILLVAVLWRRASGAAAAWSRRASTRPA